MQQRPPIEQEPTSSESKAPEEKRIALINKGKNLIKTLGISENQFRNHCLTLIKSINAEQQLSSEKTLQSRVKKLTVKLLSTLRKRYYSHLSAEAFNLSRKDFKSTLIEFAYWEIQHPEQTILFRSLNSKIFTEENEKQAVGHHNVLHNDLAASVATILNLKDGAKSFISLCNAFCEKIPRMPEDELIKHLIVLISSKQKYLMTHDKSKTANPTSERKLHVHIIQSALIQHIALFLHKNQYTQTNIETILLNRITTSIGRKNSSASVKKTKRKNQTKTSGTEPGKKAKIEDPITAQQDPTSALTEETKLIIVPQILESLLLSISQSSSASNSAPPMLRDEKNPQKSHVTTGLLTHSLFRSISTPAIPATEPTTSNSNEPTDLAPFLDQAYFPIDEPRGDTLTEELYSSLARQECYGISEDAYLTETWDSLHRRK